MGNVATQSDNPPRNGPQPRRLSLVPLGHLEEETSMIRTPLFALALASHAWPALAQDAADAAN